MRWAWTAPRSIQPRYAQPTSLIHLDSCPESVAPAVGSHALIQQKGIEHLLDTNSDFTGRGGRELFIQLILSESPGVARVASR